MKASETKTATATQPLQTKGEEQQSFFSKEGSKGVFDNHHKTFFSLKSGDNYDAKPFFTKPLIQPKLTIGQSGDKYEQEADAMAEQVVQQGEGGQRQGDTGKYVRQKSNSNLISRASVPFVPAIIARQLNEAIEGPGTDEAAIYSALAGRSQVEINEIGRAYQDLTGRDLQADLQDDLAAEELTRLEGLYGAGVTTVQSQAEAVAQQLREAIEGPGTDEQAIYHALHGRTAQMMAEIEQAYLNLTGRDLDADLQDDLTSEEYTHALEIMQGPGLSSIVTEGGRNLQLGNTLIENSAEYRRFMDAGSEWQTIHNVSADEARTASLLILNHIQNGGSFNWASDALSFVQGARQRLQHSAGMPGQPRVGREIEVLSEQAATELFSQMSTLTFFNSAGVEMPVPYHYPADGCYARAHLMAQRMTALGYSSQKKFIISTAPGGLTVESNFSIDAPAGTTPTTNWWYHVAPVIIVQRTDGTLEDRIIDPSMASSPITVDQWASMMRSDSFHEMSIADMRTFLAARTAGNVTYSADRDSFFPEDLRAGPDPAAASTQMEGVRPDLSDYAEFARVHEVAALIRRQLRNPTPDIASIISAIQALPSSVYRQYFLNNFPNLVTEMQSGLSPGDYSNIFTELNR